MQSPNAETEVHALLRNNPFVPPTGDSCYINDLPPELLSRIFEVGALDDDDGAADAWIQECYEGLEEGYESGTGTGVESADDEKVEVADQEEEEEGDGEEEEKEEEEEGDGEEEEKEEEEEEGYDEEGYDEEGDDEEYTDVTRSSDLHSPTPPFQIVVSHVCRHWRNAALSTPSLWTTIEVPFDARPPYENVSILLERSKALPIDISITYASHMYADPVDGAPSEDDLKFLYSLLVPHVQRWRLIKVEAFSDHSVYPFLSAVSDPSVPAASQLATLQLYHHRWRSTGIPCTRHYAPKFSNHFTLFGGSAPNLTKLDLHEVHIDWNQDWIASASNLRYLKLKWQREEVRPTWTQFATILRGAPQLQTLILCDSGPSGEPAEWVFEPTPERPTGDLNAPIQLLKLTHFVLSSYSPSHVLRFLPKFYLPSLKSLTLCLDGGDDADLIDQLAGPATSLSPLSAQEHPRSLLSSLEKLKFPSFSCTDESLETLCSELQNLHSLNTEPVWLSQQFVELLCRPCTLPGRGDVWLPRLKSLWISYAPGDMIRQVVQKRKDAGVPLKALYVCKTDDDDVEWFKENVETFEFFKEGHLESEEEW